MNREAVIGALFTQLSGVAGIVTKSRRLRLWQDVASGDKPALFLAERSETYRRVSEAVPAVVTLELDVYVYVATGQDPQSVPATLLNPLIDAIDAALAPSPASMVQTLGGLVSHCWIEGKIVKDPGDLDGDGVAVIPVRISMPQ